MMAALRDWLVSVSVTALLVTVLQNLLPEGALRKIGGLTGGLILLVTVMKPLPGLDTEKLELRLDTYRREIEARQTELEKLGQTELERIIARRSAAYISDKGASLGLSVTAEVATEPGDTGVPVPCSARIYGAYSELLAAYMEEELGIRRERQVWHEREN